MNFNHDLAYLFVANDRTKTMEELIAEFADMPANGVTVEYINRAQKVGGMFPQIEVRFNNECSDELYAYLKSKVNTGTNYENSLRASMFVEDVDFKCSYGLHNWMSA